MSTAGSRETLYEPEGSAPGENLLSDHTGSPGAIGLTVEIEETVTEAVDGEPFTVKKAKQVAQQLKQMSSAVGTRRTDTTERLTVRSAALLGQFSSTPAVLLQFATDEPELYEFLWSQDDQFLRLLRSQMNQKQICGYLFSLADEVFAYASDVLTPVDEGSPIRQDAIDVFKAYREAQHHKEQYEVQAKALDNVRADAEARRLHSEAQALELELLKSRDTLTAQQLAEAQSKARDFEQLYGESRNTGDMQAKQLKAANDAASQARKELEDLRRESDRTAQRLKDTSDSLDTAKHQMRNLEQTNEQLETERSRLLNRATQSISITERSQLEKRLEVLNNEFDALQQVQADSSTKEQEALRAYADLRMQNDDTLVRLAAAQRASQTFQSQAEALRRTKGQALTTDAPPRLTTPNSYRPQPPLVNLADNSQPSPHLAAPTLSGVSLAGLTPAQADAFKAVRKSLRPRYQSAYGPTFTANLLQWDETKVTEWPPLGDPQHTARFLHTACNPNELFHLCRLLVAHDQQYLTELQSVLDEEFFHVIQARVRREAAHNFEAQWQDEVYQDSRFLAFLSEEYPPLRSAIDDAKLIHDYYKSKDFLCHSELLSDFLPTLSEALERAGAEHQMSALLLQSPHCNAGCKRAYQRSLGRSESTGPSMFPNVKSSHSTTATTPLQLQIPLGLTRSQSQSPIPRMAGTAQLHRADTLPTDTSNVRGGTAPFDTPHNADFDRMMQYQQYAQFKLKSVDRPKDFTGVIEKDKMTFKVWIKKFEAFADACYLDEREKRNALGRYLQDKALEVLEGFAETAESTWSDIVAHLKANLQQTGDIRDVIANHLSAGLLPMQELPSLTINKILKELKDVCPDMVNTEKLVIPTLINKMPLKLQELLEGAVNAKAEVLGCLPMQLPYASFLTVSDNAYRSYKRLYPELFQEDQIKDKSGKEAKVNALQAQGWTAPQGWIPPQGGYNPRPKWNPKGNNPGGFAPKPPAVPNPQITPSVGGGNAPEAGKEPRFRSRSRSRGRGRFKDNPPEAVAQQPQEQPVTERKEYEVPPHELQIRRNMGIPDTYKGRVEKFKGTLTFPNSANPQYTAPPPTGGNSGQKGAAAAANLPKGGTNLLMSFPTDYLKPGPKLTKSNRLDPPSDPTGLVSYKYDPAVDPFPPKLVFDDSDVPFGDTFNFDTRESCSIRWLHSQKRFAPQYQKILTDAVYEMRRCQASLDGVAFLPAGTALEAAWIPRYYALRCKRAAEIIFSATLYNDPEYRACDTNLMYYVKKYIGEPADKVERFGLKGKTNRQIFDIHFAEAYPGVSILDLHERPELAGICKRLHLAMMVDYADFIYGPHAFWNNQLPANWEKWIETSVVATLTCDTQPLKVMATFDHRIAAVTSIDTGSSTSLIRSDFFYTHLSHLPWTEAKVSLTCYNDVPVRLLGALVVPVTIGNTTVDVTFHVAEGGPFSALLGTDWSKLVGKVTTDFTKNTVRLRKDRPQPLYPPIITNEWPVRLKEDEVFPARSRKRVMAQLPMDFPLGTLINVETNFRLYRRFGLTLAHSLHQPDKFEVIVEVMNASTVNRRLTSGTTLARAVLTLDAEDPNFFDTPQEKLSKLQDSETLMQHSVNLLQAAPATATTAFELPVGIQFKDSNMDAAQQCRLAELIHQYRDIFASNDYDVGHCEVVKVEIDTGTNPPFKLPNHRTAHADKQVTQKIIQDMLLAGIIEPAASPYSSPINIVRKKDGTPRFTVDFRRLNSQCVKDVYPLPRIDDTLEMLAKRQWLTTMDLNSGFHNIVIDKLSRPRTAFRVEGGQYQYAKLPMGLSISPAICQRTMEILLADLNWSSCLIYMDDIIVPSATFEEHLVSLQRVFDALRFGKMKLKGKKCHFACKELIFLGFLITKDGIRVNPEKLDAVKRFPVPTNIRMLRRFLGLASHYRRHIPRFANIIQPFLELLRKDVVWQWSTECDKAFLTLKAFLLSDQVVALPDFSKPFYLHVDTSGYAIGSALMQKDDRKLDKVIAFASFNLDKHQRNYTATKRELYGLYRAMRYFRPYILNQETIVITDHNALTTMQENTHFQTDDITAIWLTNLGEFRDYKIVHRKGEEHYVPDALSRYLPSGKDPQIPSLEEMQSWILRDHPDTTLTANESDEFQGNFKRLKKKRATPNRTPRMAKQMDLRQQLKTVEDEAAATETAEENLLGRQLKQILAQKDRPEPQSSIPLPPAKVATLQSSQPTIDWMSNALLQEPTHFALSPNWDIVVNDKESQLNIDANLLQPITSVDLTEIDWSSKKFKMNFNPVSQSAAERCCIITEPEGLIESDDTCLICHEPEDDETTDDMEWFRCDDCHSWCHQKCAGIKLTSTDTSARLQTYFCPACTAKRTKVSTTDAEGIERESSLNIWRTMSTPELSAEQDKDTECTYMKQFLLHKTLPDEVSPEIFGYYERSARNYQVDNGVLMRLVQDTKPGQLNLLKQVICVPPALRRKALELCHDDPVFGGHLGFDKTYGKVVDMFDWPSVRRDVKNFCSYCDKCQKKKLARAGQHATLTPIVVGSRMEKLAVDFSGPFPVSKGGNKYILSFIDLFSGYAECFATADRKAETVAKIFLREIVSRYGVPRYLLSDQGAEFVSQLFRNVCTLVGTTKVCTSAYHPQTNGKCERHHRTLNSMLSMYVSETHSDWDQHLPMLKLAYNTSIHASTGYTPQELFTGSTVRTPVQNLHSAEGLDKRSLSDYVATVKKRIQDTEKLVRGQMTANQAAQKESYDSTARLTVLKVGDIVLLSSIVVARGQTPKWTTEGKGPFVVTAVYKPANYDVARLQQEPRKKNYLKKVARARLHLYRIDPDIEEEIHRQALAAKRRAEKEMPNRGIVLLDTDDPDESDAAATATPSSVETGATRTPATVSKPQPHAAKKSHPLSATLKASKPTGSAVLNEQQLRDSVESELNQKALDLRRTGYFCGDRYVTLDSVQTWREYASRLPLAVEPSVPEVESENLNDQVRIHLGDITLLEVDAIVNAANHTLCGTEGVCKAIRQAAGEDMQAECDSIPGGCPTGQARITKGYRLPAGRIIHAVGPRNDPNEQILASTYWSSLDLARKAGIHSIAFPCIGTGLFGFPMELATPVALRTVRQWLLAHNDYHLTVIFSLVTSESVTAYNEHLPKVFPIAQSASIPSGKGPVAETSTRSGRTDNQAYANSESSEDRSYHTDSDATDFEPDCESTDESAGESVGQSDNQSENDTRLEGTGNSRPQSPCFSEEVEIIPPTDTFPPQEHHMRRSDDNSTQSSKRSSSPPRKQGPTVMRTEASVARGLRSKPQPKKQWAE